MTVTGNNTNKNQNSNNFSNTEDIDIIEFLKIFLRNKYLIFNVIFVFFVFGIVYTLNLKRLWQGNFQIVLEQKSKDDGIGNSNLSSNLSPLQLLGNFNFGGGTSSLETELGILKSPSVLSEAFEFVKVKKNPTINSAESNLNFLTWRNSSLKIELEDNTSILNLSYIDSDKDLILPVLEKISRDYQKYSGRKRVREIQLGKDFFKAQIEKYKEKSSNSLKNLQSFSAKYDLTAAKSGEGYIKTLAITNIEETRIKSGNAIRNLNLKLEQLDTLSREEAFVLIKDTIFVDLDSPIIERISDLDANLASRKLAYLGSDKAIIDLEKEKSSYIDVLRTQAKIYLKSLIKNEEAKLGASERPKGVVFRFKQLLKEAVKDESTLQRLEADYRSLLLEESRIKDPWELITSPNLIEYPVAPRRKFIVLTWCLIGFFVGTIISLIKERIKGFIFSCSEIETILGKPNLSKLVFNDQDQLNEDLELMFKGRLFAKNKNIHVLQVGKINESVDTKINEFINKTKSDNTKIINSIRDVDPNSNIVLLLSLGKFTRKQLLMIKQKIELLGLSNMGSIIIDNQISKR